MVHRVTEGMKKIGGLREVWSRGKWSRETKVKMFESCCIPTVLYGSKTWAMDTEV